ncbi:MAG: hypothetical protein U9R75_04465, partial [Candidatus Thermoplasmatota archaeon]|nr:hypothetical protein [Candidatus Thermoplasmatota archaeon]
MDKRFAFSITVLMVMVAFMPFLTIAEPTRAGEAELTGVIISGSQAPGGEYKWLRRCCCSQWLLKVFSRRLTQITLISSIHLFILTFK